MKRFACGIAPVLMAAAALGLMGCPTGPVLAVYPSALDFGTGETADALTITNAGQGSLTWSIQGLPPWLTASEQTGAVNGDMGRVTLTADRTELDAGRHTAEFVLSSNGGSELIGVSIQVGDGTPPGEQVLEITPGGLSFGAQTETLDLSVVNTGSGSLPWSVTPGAAWLSASPDSGAVTAAGATVEVSVSRDGLDAGAYEADLVFAATPDEGDEQTVTVTVTMTVPGTEPILEVDPLEVDFGVAAEVAEFTIANAGVDALDWSVDASAVPWLTAAPASGTDGAVITLTADRSGLSAGSYDGAVQVASNGGTAAVNVSLEVAPPTLAVAPSVLDFGDFADLKFASVRNAGSGAVTWELTSTQPAWLALSDDQGTVVAGADPTGVQVEVNRAGLEPGSYDHALVFEGGAGEPQTILVRMSVPLQPVLSAVSEDGNRGPNEPLVSFGTDLVRRPLQLSNTGDGPLTWRVDPEELPGWLNVNPLSGSLQPGDSITAYWFAEREGLGSGGYDVEINVTSNGGTALVYATMQVPLQKSIVVSSSDVNLGVQSRSGAFSVANGGDVGTTLDFQVSTVFDWLFISPATGSSQGTAGPIKDWRTVFVSVDRGGIEGQTGATGFVVIQALDENQEVDPTIPSKEVRVSFEAAPLSFEAARAQTRIPSLVRFVFMMRDVRDEAFAMMPARIYGNRPQHLPPDERPEPFILYEDDVAIEAPSETSVTLWTQKNTSPMVTEALDDYDEGSAPPQVMDLKTRIVLLLDYSGSMETFASEGHPGGIQDVYASADGSGEDAIVGFIEDLFEAFGNTETGFLEVTVMEFHDRSVAPTTVLEFTNREPDVSPLRSLDITDHGASAILPAVESAAFTLAERDRPFIPYDSADVNAVVLVSDGRLTTPPGLVNDTIDVLEPLRVRAFPVGYGAEVNHEPMARLAAGTGGHYYPVLSETLGDKLATVARELSSHMVLQYVTLREEDSINVRFSSTLYRESDQPAIQGGLEAQLLDLLNIVGDERMGQISLRSPGIGAPEGNWLYVHLGYAPRNVNYLSFQVTGPGGAAFDDSAVALAPGNEEGAAPDWNLTKHPGGVYELESATGEPLDYGQRGDLLWIALPNGAAAPYPVHFSFISAAPPAKGEASETKYFIAPDYMEVGQAPTQAPAFPTAVFEPEMLVFGPGETEKQLTVRNIGGHYTQGAVDIQLYWEIQDNPLTTEVSRFEGSVASATTEDVITVSLDDGIPRPSGFQGYVFIDYSAGDLGLLQSALIPVFVEP